MAQQLPEVALPEVDTRTFKVKNKKGVTFEVSKTYYEKNKDKLTLVK